MRSATYWALTLVLAVCAVPCLAGEPGERITVLPPEINPYYSTVFVQFRHPDEGFQVFGAIQFDDLGLVNNPSYGLSDFMYISKGSSTDFFGNVSHHEDRAFVSYKTNTFGPTSDVAYAEIRLPIAPDFNGTYRFTLHSVALSPYSFQYDYVSGANPFYTTADWHSDSNVSQIAVAGGAFRHSALGSGPVIGEFSGYADKEVIVKLNEEGLRIIRSNEHLVIGITMESDNKALLFSNGPRIAGPQPILKMRRPITAKALEDWPNTPGCPDCPLPKGGCTRNLSVVDNTQLGYIHDAMDYSVGLPDVVCKTCSASANTTGTLPALSIKRIHRYRDIEPHASFGPGVFMNYDLSLCLYPNYVEFWDPNGVSVIGLSDNGNGEFTDSDQSRLKNLKLYDAANNPVSTYAQAATAVITLHTGETYTFQLFRTDCSQTLDYAGRIVRIADRNNNAIVLTYTDANPNASDADLGFDRSKLWRIATITDAYNLSANFTYSRAVGQWCVSQIALPNGSHIDYGYSDSTLAGLSDIAHPDGSASTFRTREDAFSRCQVVSFDDGAAADTHRRKDVYFSKHVFDDVNQPSNRVRKIYNGAGECAYYNWTRSNGPLKSTYAYEGGGDTNSIGTMLRYDTIDGVPSKTYRASAWTADSPESTWTYELVEDYSANGQSRLTGIKDPENRRTQYDRDPVTGAITGETRFNADGTVYASESSSYNDFMQPLLHTDRLSRVTKSEYDASGNLFALHFAFGSADQADSAWTYNARGQPLTFTDANGNVTNYHYDDPRGFLTSIEEPPDNINDARAVRSFTHDAAGRLATTTDAAGRVTTFNYDARNRVQAITYNDASTDTFLYGTGGFRDANLILQREDRNHNVTAFRYDDNGRLIHSAVVNPNGSPAEDAVKDWTYMTGTNLPHEVIDRGERTRFEYDYRNRLITTLLWTTASHVLISRHHYDINDRVDYDTDPFGRRTFYIYDVEDRLARVAKETVQNSLFNVDIAALPRNASNNAPYILEDVGYDVESQVLKRTDPRGVVNTFEYDFHGRLKASTAAAAKLDANGTETPIADPKIAARTENTFDPQGNLLSVKHPRSFDQAEGGDFITKYTYTGRNLLASMTVAFGRPEVASQSFTYNLDRRIKDTTDGRGKVWTTLWKQCCGRMAAKVDPLLPDGTRPLTFFNYNHSGDLTHTARLRDISSLPNCCSPDPLDADTLLEATTRYDARHRPVAHTVWLAPLGQVDENNPPIAGDDGFPAANGLTTRWSYSDDVTAGGFDPYGVGFGDGANGYSVTTTNANNESSVSVYDGIGRLVRSIDANGNASRVTYDTQVFGTPNAPGTLIETTYFDGLNHTGRARMDGAGRILASIDAEFKLTSYAVDADGNRVSVRDPNGVGVDCVFDERGRVKQCTDTHGDVTKNCYDAHSNVIKITDALTHDTISVYDGRNRKTSSTDRNNGVAQYTYDPNNNLLTITDADANHDNTGKQTTYTYDNRNLLESETFPDDKTRAYTYDPANRLASRVDQTPATTTYLYDMASRLSSRHYADNLDDVFTYDPVGRMLTAQSLRYGNLVTRTYDPGGRLSTDTLTVGAQNFAMGYGYDAANLQTSVTYPDGIQVMRTFTNRNQLANVYYNGDFVAARSYDNGMRLQTSVLGNSLVETRTYRNDNLSDTIKVPGVTDFTYAWDANKRKTSEADAAIPVNTQTYGYDNDDRLTSFNRNNGDSQTWNLSLVGDWQSAIFNGTPDTRTHDAVHELTVRNGTPLHYDNKGNLTDNSNGQSYTWDVENRMQSATIAANPDPIVATYAYDALGRRVSKTVAGLTTIFACDGIQEIAEYENGADPTVPTREYVFGSYIDEPLMMVTGGAKYYYHANSQYSVTAITDSTGAVVERMKFDPYGKATVLAPDAVTVRAVSSIGNPWGFQGRRPDGETGLMFYRTRYYDISLGRFLNRMPWNALNGQTNFVNYLTLMPVAWSGYRPSVDGTLSKSQGSYTHRFYNLYDFESVNPSNRLEPFSNDTAELHAEQGQANANNAKNSRAPEANPSGYMTQGTWGPTLRERSEDTRHYIADRGGNILAAGEMTYTAATGKELRSDTREELSSDAQYAQDTRTEHLMDSMQGEAQRQVVPMIEVLGMYAGMKMDAMMDAALNPGKCPSKGMNNSKTAKATNMGNKVHYDELNGGTGQQLPTALQNEFPETEFNFTRRGAAGADVEVTGGTHPSEYPGSTWSPENDFADFKPNTESGAKTFEKDIIKGKLPVNTEPLPYNPQTGKLEMVK